MKKVLFTADEETIAILEAYVTAGAKKSPVIREALKKYFHFNKPKLDPTRFDGVDEVSHGESGVVIYD